MFTTEKTVASKFYNYFSLAGATFVVADNDERKFIILQDEVSGAKAYKVSLRLPIRKLPSSLGLGAQDHWGRLPNYSKFCFRIFQIQRAHEGLGEYGPTLVLTREPEFLSGLDRTAVVTTQGDRAVCDGWTMYKALLAWRWLHWIIFNHGRNIKFHSKNFDDLYFRNPTQIWPPASRLFSRTYLQELGAGYGPSDLPEYAILRFDDEAAWTSAAVAGDGTSWRSQFKKWEKYRTLLDTVKPEDLSFEVDYRRLQRIYYPIFTSNRLSHADRLLLNSAYGGARAINNWLFRTICRNRTVTAVHALTLLHETIKAPIPAYFYYIMVDGRPKSHVVMPLIRSAASPINYEVGRRRLKHTAVGIALASVEVRGKKDLSHYVGKTAQLKHALRICADRIIDGIFIRSLRGEDERRRERARVLSTYTDRNLPGVFVLGSWDRNNVTIMSQQSRALSLIRALDEKSVLQNLKDSRIAIVGGGITGVTSAAALLKLGSAVDLYEKEGSVIALQEHARHRYIHPFIANWPSPGSMLDAAGLPVMTWAACNADELCSQLRRQVEQTQSEFPPPNFDLVRNTEISGIRKEDKELILCTSKGERRRHKLVILTVGFGLEKRLPSFTPPSYWEPDGLEDGLVGWRGKSAPVLVAGVGDGGLIDLARASIRSPNSRVFDHKRLIDHLTKGGALERFALKLRDIDQSIAICELTQGPASLWDAYNSCFDELSQVEKDTLIGGFTDLWRTDRQVFFAHRSPVSNLLRPDTALVNRLVAFLILKSGRVTLIQRNIIDVARITDDGINAFRVSYLDGSVQDFAKICLRLGPEGDQLHRAAAQLKNRRPELDLELTKLKIGIDFNTDDYEWYKSRFRLSRAVKSSG
jgi:hypothetical protein